MDHILAAMLCGFLLDLLLGDPVWVPWPHPVVVMGRCVNGLEVMLRKIFPATHSGELAAGCVLAGILPLGTVLLCWGVLYLAELVSPWVSLGLEILLCWQALAMKDLRMESERVYHALETGTLEEARTAVGRIVGRDTAKLSRDGVTRAAVETVAENFSDGVSAPLCFMMLGGAPLALCYKAINTMDSMVGYKNEAYRYFGRAAAKLDDAANYLPSRLSALLLIIAAALRKQDGRNAWRIWRRDRRCHASPNSAQCEEAMAGALHVQLAGPAYYFGKLYNKPTIGDSVRPIEPKDITRANRMMYTAGFLCVTLLAGVRVLFLGI